jgi:hypothetical protein
MKNIIAILLFSTFGKTSFAQAKLTVNNNSQRNMTVKVMRGTGKGSLYKTVTIAAYASAMVYFNQSGTYFTKTRATLSGKDPIYQKGSSFHVTNDETGYSVLTISFTIKESSVPQTEGGARISKSEFDQN